MDLETAAKELKLLAGREKLTAAELERAKELMRELKAVGMSNSEIVDLTGGRWSESTAKGYTRGVRTDAAQPWKSTTALFSQMLSENLTLENVSQAIAMKAEVENMGWSLNDLVAFMAEVKKEGTTVAELQQAADIEKEMEAAGTSPGEMATFVQQLKDGGIDVEAFAALFRKWQESGLTPADARSMLNHKSQLEEAGLDIDTESRIADAARKYGSPEGVFQAIQGYGTILELDEQIRKKREELEEISKALEGRRNEVNAAEKEARRLAKGDGHCRKAACSPQAA